MLRILQNMRLKSSQEKKPAIRYIKNTCHKKCHLSGRFHSFIKIQLLWLQICLDQYSSLSMYSSLQRYKKIYISISAGANMVQNCYPLPVLMAAKYMVCCPSSKIVLFTSEHKRNDILPTIKMKHTMYRIIVKWMTK